MPPLGRGCYLCWSEVSWDRFEIRLFRTLSFAGSRQEILNYNCARCLILRGGHIPCLLATLSASGCGCVQTQGEQPLGETHTSGALASPDLPNHIGCIIAARTLPHSRRGGMEGGGHGSAVLASENTYATFVLTHWTDRNLSLPGGLCCIMQACLSQV